MCERNNSTGRGSVPIIVGVLMGLAIVLAAPQTPAQAFPSKQIVWVVPFPPGGITDITSRMISKHVGTELGVSVIVDNRPGAGGAVGTDQVARAAPDGHTVLYGTQGTMAANPHLYRSIRYQPLRDFVPVHGMFASPNVIVSNPSRPFQTLAEMVAFAKAHPGKLSLASAGAGTGTHLAGELMQVVTGAKLTHVPYKGSAAALTDLIGGRTDVMFDYAVSAGPHVLAGKLRGLAVTQSTRLALLPDVPTTVEAGVEGIETFSWSGLFVPAKTPPAIVARLEKAMAAAMASAEVAAYAEKHGSRILTGMTSASLAKFLESDSGRWADIVRRADLRLE
jgi:tripartite-type tricarboxylate transporter receptor subunit TctC